MSIWIARDKDRTLGAYSRKPERRKVGYFSDYSLLCTIPKHHYPEVTWENSPLKLEVDFSED